MNTLGERIREARDKMGLYQGQLGMALGVSGAVISNWEKGLNKPDADKLVRLCEVLNVPIAYLLDCWTGGEARFSMDEWTRVKKYRVLDLHGKKIVDTVLDEEYARMTRHDDALVEHRDNITYINCYDLAVSAGTGEPLGDTYYKTRLEIPTERVPENAHYCLRVNGDSMEPADRDGDIVFVERLDGSVSEGEIGIFFLNGEGFIKRLGDHRLISLNEKYPPILISDYDRLDCQGRVLGKL